MTENDNLAMNVKGLDLWYGEKQALFKVDMPVRRNCITALIGPSGCGKSTLLRTLNRMNDLVDGCRVEGEITFDGKNYTIIDTAGIRKKARVEDDVEYYSVMRAFDAVRRADVCLLVVDSTEGLTEQDTKIIGYVHEQGKPSVIVMNKWDIVEKDTNTINKFEDKLKEDLKFMDYFKSIYVSAKTGQRTEKIMAAVDKVYENAHFRIPTGTLNDLISDTVRANEPPSYNGRRLRVYYSSQVAVAPPTFVLFVNSEDLLHFSYERFLENTIRKAFDFSGTPIRIVVREKKEG